MVVGAHAVVMLPHFVFIVRPRLGFHSQMTLSGTRTASNGGKSIPFRSSGQGPWPSRSLYFWLCLRERKQRGRVCRDEARFERRRAPTRELGATEGKRAQVAVPCCLSSEF